MHDSVMQWCATKVPTEPVKVLDIGGRNINGTTRHLFAEGSEIVSVDLEDGPDVDVVGDICDLDLGDDFDVAICTSVLEHAENWRDILRAAWRHLRDGGMVIVTAAGPGWSPHSKHDGQSLRPDEYYANISSEELMYGLAEAGFMPVFAGESDPDHGKRNDVRAQAWKD